MYIRLYAFLSICAVFLIVGNCDNPTSQPEKEELLDFTYFTESQYKAARTWKGNSALQSAVNVPPYGCYVSVYQDGETKPWKFWSIALNYPKRIVKKAEGAKVKVKIRINDVSGERLIRMANCIIPRAPKAKKMLKKLMTKGARNVREDLGQNNSGKSSDNNDDPVINSCIIVQGGYKCPDGYCFVSEEMCYSREGGYSLPEIIVYGDDGGGSDDSGGGTGGDDDGGYDPPDGGPDPGGGGPCIDCDPGGDGSDSECDPNAIDPPAGCEDVGGASPPDPCEGNVVENPEIAPSGGWNEWGGQFGYTRNSGNTFHDGTDIKADINSNLYAMHGGTVTDIRDSFDPGEYKPDSYGNYVRIKSTLSGDTVYLRYNHLNTVGVEVGDTVIAGDIIGRSGNTGNAQEMNGIPVIPHVHIRARKVENGQEKRVDPENYMATKFNNDGSVNVSESNCN